MREKARASHRRAVALLAAGDERSLRYASLELRYCIEYLLLDRLQSYLEYLSDAAMLKWTPKKMLRELLEADPDAETNVTLAVGLEEKYGEPATTMHVLGEDRRLKLKWANVNWNALGNFLHAPTLEQQRTGKVPTVETIKKRAGDIADHLSGVLDAAVWNVTGGQVYELSCPECGTTTRRLVAGFSTERGFVCKNPECRTIYDVAEEAAGVVRFSARMRDFRCNACGHSAPFKAHHVTEGNTLVCDGCGAKWRLAMHLVALQFSEDKATDDSRKEQGSSDIPL